MIFFVYLGLAQKWKFYLLILFAVKTTLLILISKARYYLLSRIEFIETLSACTCTMHFYMYWTLLFVSFCLLLFTSFALNNVYFYISNDVLYGAFKNFSYAIKLYTTFVMYVNIFITMFILISRAFCGT